MRMLEGTNTRPNCCRDDLDVSPQRLCGKLERQALLLDGGEDDVAMCAQLLRSVLQDEAVLAHGGQDHLVVGLERRCGFVQGVTVLEHSCRDNLAIAPHELCQMVNGIAINRQCGQNDIRFAEHDVGHGAPVRNPDPRTLHPRRPILEWRHLYESEFGDTVLGGLQAAKAFRVCRHSGADGELLSVQRDQRHFLELGFEV
mmetsp:Transcript_13583/g.28373  ORF Transcript_13583/g.28373 Transcript_13583/m.28373 type:complete len:200 (-) Transcript_13583:79-678(-)